MTLCCTHSSPERTPEPPHGPEGGAVPLAVNGAHLQSFSSVVCLNLLTFGRSLSARPEKVRTYLPVLPPAPATPAHLPHLLQVRRQAGRAALPAVRTVTARHRLGGRAVFCRARAAPRRRHVCSCRLWFLAAFPGSSPRLTELLVREHVLFLPGLAAACQLLYKYSPVSRAPPGLFSLLSSALCGAQD